MGGARRVGLGRVKLGGHEVWRSPQGLTRAS
jgi:hypothetical protein